MFWKLIAKEASDCSFAVGLAPQKVFYANKVVLGANSPVLFEMLYGEMEGSREETPVDLSDVDPVAFEFFLEFCYTRDIYRVNTSNWCMTGRMFQCVASNLCVFCKKRRSFLEHFPHICYLNEKFNNKEFAAYSVGCVDSNFRYLPHDLIVPIYVGASLIRSKELKAKLEGKIKGEVKKFLNHSQIKDLRLDDFIHLIHLLCEHHYESGESRFTDSYFFPDLFAAMDGYAKCTCRDPGGRRRAKLQIAFLLMLHDARMTKDDFILGPAKSSFLTDDEAKKVLQRFHPFTSDL